MDFALGPNTRMSATTSYPRSRKPRSSTGDRTDGRTVAQFLSQESEEHCKAALWRRDMLGCGRSEPAQRQFSCCSSRSKGGGRWFDPDDRRCRGLVPRNPRHFHQGHVPRKRRYPSPRTTGLEHRNSSMSQPQHKSSAGSLGRWTTCALYCIWSPLQFVYLYYYEGLQSWKGTESMTQFGLGATHPKAVLNIGLTGQGSKYLLVNALLANTRQVIMSRLYFNCNALYTSLCMAIEWDR
ncbi:hypothetical protein CTA2_4777 [Colletotrichum tanaceti]|uniref:Uncharacterized protein n=1 Tax=Colletotrichum tanaceti TaxID=1306861 RepID=A0A4U6X7A6_9PEZI|nr:hypothetical protein CTA2_4777 [Colletotrichum tanaceti]TKW51004.1 hypothetical protein CTA1_840 [Colletotrichum tanaceti]